MNFLSPEKLPIFNFLTIGQRGVGKTVFLAGCYAEINDGFFRQREDQSLWFRPSNRSDKKHLDSLLNYVAKTGTYPPATLKITEFNFDLKRQDRWGTTTLCHFRWYDIPGEYCDFEHPSFQQMVLNSHGCCVFLNADHLVNVPTYLESLDSVFQQVISVASLRRKKNAEYAFAIIFTQCDRLSNKAHSRLQIEEKIRPFIIALETTGAKYLRFYSEVPIVKGENHYQLNPKGTAVSLLWLVSEWQKASRKSAHASPKRGIGLIWDYLNLAYRYRRWLLAIGVGGAVLASSIVFALHLNGVSLNLPWTTTAETQIRQYQSVLQRNPNDFETLVALAELYLAQGQLEEALPLIENITQQQPDQLDWQLNLAKLYELTNKSSQAEAVYDRILAQEDQHFYALLGKAFLRQKEGDRQTAQLLFQKAERVAPTDKLKDQVRRLCCQEE